MNFSIRLGYHFSQVEAWVGDQLTTTTSASSSRRRGGA